METQQWNVFHIKILMTSTFPSTMWDKPSKSYRISFMYCLILCGWSHMLNTTQFLDTSIFALLLVQMNVVWSLQVWHNSCVLKSASFISPHSFPIEHEQPSVSQPTTCLHVLIFNFSLVFVKLIIIVAILFTLITIRLGNEGKL